MLSLQDRALETAPPLGLRPSESTAAAKSGPVASTAQIETIEAPPGDPLGATNSAVVTRSRPSQEGVSGHLDGLPAGKDLDRIHGAVSLEQAVRETLARHPRLAARRHEVEFARAQLVTASLFPNPQLVLDTDSPINETGPTELSGRLTFTIPTAGKFWLAQETAKAGIARARWAVDTEALELLTETVEAGYELLYLQELAKVQSQIAALAEQAVEMQRGRLEAGGITAFDALVVEVDAVDVVFDQLKTDTALEMARVRLARAMGYEQADNVSVSGELTVEPVGDLQLDVVLAEARRARPELAGAQAAINESQRRLAQAVAEASPDFDIGPRYRTELGERQDSMGVRFSSDIPWFDRNQGNILGGDARIRAELAQYQALTIATLADAATAFSQLAPLERALDQYQQQVEPLARRVEETLRDADESPKIDSVKISVQLRKLAEVRAKQLRLRYQHALLRTKLELFLGRRMSDLGSVGTPMSRAASQKNIADPYRALLAPPVQPPLLHQPPDPLELPHETNGDFGEASEIADSNDLAPSELPDQSTDETPPAPRGNSLSSAPAKTDGKHPTSQAGNTLRLRR